MQCSIVLADHRRVMFHWIRFTGEKLVMKNAFCQSLLSSNRCYCISASASPELGPATLRPLPLQVAAAGTLLPTAVQALTPWH